jgi:outer membrane protein OmpA-like peptidoglycan-associated protein
MNRFNRYLLCSALAVIAVACASTPKRIAVIEDARATLQQVESMPLAGEVAAKELESAHIALRQAEELAEDRASADKINNAAYISKRHSQIAQQQIAAAQAKKSIETAERERQAVLLEARDREAQLSAETAQIQAREAARQAEELARKNREAEAANAQVEALQRELAELNAKKTERGLVLTLGDVLFDTGKATLKPGARPAIERLAKFLKDSPERGVVIEGHTDSVGSDELNQELSERRADAVRSALVGQGVPSDRINAVGKGEAFPVASNDSAGGRQQNRRVEIVIEDQVKASSLR